VVNALIIGATIQTTSSRYLRYPDLNVPVVTMFGADLQYRTHLFNNDATFWLQAYNLSNTYSLNADPSAQTHAADPSRYELSLTVDF